MSGNGTSATKRLVVADPLLPEGLDVLREATGLAVEDHTEDDRSQLTEALHGASGLIVRSRTKVDAELIRSGEALEVIGRAGAGVDNIDMAAATRRGIAVLNAPGANTVSTAELAFGLIIAAARRIAEADASVRAGEWKRKELRGSQLCGKTLGVVGAGRIGAEVARRGRAFGMRVIAHDPYITAERAAELGFELAALDELLPAADVLTLHVPLTDENRGLIGRAEIAALPEGAILVNAARGGLVDEAALAEALASGHLSAAGLDVFENEPLPENSPLRGARNLVVSPHIGASTVEAQREVSRQIAVAVRDALLSDDYQAALNAPYEAGDRDRTGPVMELGRRLGTLLAGLEDGPEGRLEVRYAGSVDGVLRPLAAAAVEGFLRHRVAQPINVVNALSVASERGLEVARVRTGAVADYTNYVEIECTYGDHATTVGGALLGERQHARIVRIGRFHVDTVPGGTLLLIRNRDVPGVIGEVGSKLGQADVNIAEYHQSRREAGGKALGVVTVDGAVPGDVLTELRGLPAVEEVRQVVFD
ncbi:MAG: phosphoglycerate dehydrogenase [Gemmatimonadetes bacterium]|nr:phosphoglycerate dehydrogenase [Gemmatimonadota bacterium]